MVKDYREKYKENKKEEIVAEKKEVISEAKVVEQPIVVAEQIEQPKISFDAFFQMVCTRTQEVKGHHYLPVKRFMEQFGDLNSQTIDWFEENFKKY